MIVLFTDYGIQGPYIGQVKVVLHQQAPRVKVINLFADLPRQHPKAAAYLLPAYVNEFPEGSIFFCVVDPGVGSGKHKPVALKIDNYWFIGPDNGLFDIVARKANNLDCMEITWRPQKLSNSFHGRDLYAPVCAMLAKDIIPDGKKYIRQDYHNWPDDLYEIIYIDGFGNVVTGIRSGQVGQNVFLNINGHDIKNAKTFSDVQLGQAFWYENANGLVEIAVNQGSAKELLDLKISDTIKQSKPRSA